MKSSSRFPRTITATTTTPTPTTESTTQEPCAHLDLKKGVIIINHNSINNSSSINNNSHRRGKVAAIMANCDKGSASEQQQNVSGTELEMGSAPLEQQHQRQQHHQQQNCHNNDPQTEDELDSDIHDEDYDQHQHPRNQNYEVDDNAAEWEEDEVMMRGHSHQDEDDLTNSSSASAPEDAASAATIPAGPAPRSIPSPFSWRSNWMRGGLHHRHSRQNNAHATNGGTPDNKYRKQVLLYNNNHHSHQQHHHFFPSNRMRSNTNGSMGNASIPGGHSTRSCGKTVQIVLLFVALGYLALVINIYRNVISDDAYTYYYTDGGGAGNAASSAYYYFAATSGVDYSYLLDQMEKRQLARLYLEEKEASARQRASSDLETRADLRRMTTRPPPITTAAMSLKLPFPATRILRPDEHIRPMYDRQLEQKFSTANAQANDQAASTTSISGLCGYLSNDVTNAAVDQKGEKIFVPLTNSSRVLVSGLLSHPLGMQMAVTLIRSCGVQAIMVIDPMIPNTISHRLELQQRIALITSTRQSNENSTSSMNSKHQQQTKVSVLTSNLGLHVTSSSSSSKKVVSTEYSLPATGETDWIQTFCPTHIVHFSSLSNTAAHVPSTSGSSHNVSDSYFIQSTLAGTEQLLAALRHFISRQSALDTNSPKVEDTKNKRKAQPQFVQVVLGSDHYDNGIDEISSSSQQQKQEPYHDRRHAVLSSKVGLLQQILADVYGESYGVETTTVRIPNAILGPWTDYQSTLYKVFQDSISSDESDDEPQKQNEERGHFDLLSAQDSIAGVLGALQIRPERTMALALQPVGRLTFQELRETAKMILTKDIIAKDKSLGNETKKNIGNSIYSLMHMAMQRVHSVSTSPAVELTKQFLHWSPRTTVHEALVRTIAWHFDQKYPYTKTKPKEIAGAVLSSKDVLPATGDDVLEMHKLPTCSSDDVPCHMSREFLPCSSECSSKKQCTPSIFDSIVPLMKEITEECDYVLYTNVIDVGAKDMDLETEYMDEGDPLICTLAFVAYESKLVQRVLMKIPDEELVKFGVVLQPRPMTQDSDQQQQQGQNQQQETGKPQDLNLMKREKLNGRLLYHGWILVWPDADVPKQLSHADSFLLKLSPGRLFSNTIKQAVFVEQTFAVSPYLDDVFFLTDILHRPALPERAVKRKTPTKAKIILPPEPARRAVILMPQLRHQESKDDSRMMETSDHKISIKQASRFMRYEKGGALAKEDPIIKAQREFYERATSIINRNTARSPTLPPFSFRLQHWVRSKWIVHDLQYEEARQLRCDWYSEHLQWENSTLDQLSFAYIMARREAERRIAFEELDDKMRSALSDHVAIKRQLTDTFEWHALKTERNRGYSPYSEVQILPYDHFDLKPAGGETSTPAVVEEENPLLFVRIISDRVMSDTRKAWNRKDEASGGKKE